jgi:D-lactate dehydrogenase (cytochrome)
VNKTGRTLADLQRVLAADRFSASQADRAQHAKDQSVHPAVLPDAAVFYPPEDLTLRAQVLDFNSRLVQRAIELGGTSTGEHGVGLGKQKFMELEHGPGALNVMRQIKQLLDPNNLLNPGKVLALE